MDVYFGQQEFVGARLCINEFSINHCCQAIELSNISQVCDGLSHIAIIKAPMFYDDAASDRDCHHCCLGSNHNAASCSACDNSGHNSRSGSHSGSTPGGVNMKETESRCSASAGVSAFDSSTKVEQVSRTAGHQQDSSTEGQRDSSTNGQQETSTTGQQDSSTKEQQDKARHSSSHLNSHVIQHITPSPNMEPSDVSYLSASLNGHHSTQASKPSKRTACSTPAGLIVTWMMLIACQLALHVAGQTGTSSSAVTPMAGYECTQDFTARVDGIFRTALPNTQPGSLRGVRSSTSNASTQAPAKVEKLVQSVLVPCLEGSTDQTVSILVQRAAPMGFLQSLLQSIAASYSSHWGPTDPHTSEIQINGVATYSDLLSSVQQFVQRNLSLAASSGFVYGGLLLPDFIGLGAMADLSTFLQDDSTAEQDWQDIMQFARQQLSVYGGRIVGIPLMAQANYMFIRKDLLRRANLSYPNTWDEVLHVIRTLNGTDMNGDGKPDWGTCIPYFPSSIAEDGSTCNYAHNLLWDVMGPYLQSNGTTSGMAIDPDNMRLLVNSEGGRAAVAVIQQMLKYRDPASLDKCGLFSPTFAAGECAVVLARFLQFKDSQVGNSSKLLRGRVAVLPVPGSLQVLDRSSMTLQTCNASYCPAAQYRQLMNGSYAYVNLAPFIPAAGIAGAVTSISPSAVQEATFKFLSYAAASNLTMHSILDPAGVFVPVRHSQLDAGRWVAAGYDAGDVAAALSVTRQLLDSKPGDNVVVDMGVQHYVSDIMPQISSLLAQLQRGVLTGPELLSELESQWLQWFDKWGWSNVQQQYRSAINWKGYRQVQARSAPAPPSPHHNRGMSAKSIRITASVGAVIAFLVAVALVMTLVSHSAKRRKRFLFGRVRAPRAGPEATLVVVEPANAPALWDLLPSDVMTLSIKVYQECLRSLLPEHNGYECSQDGDTLVLAFHEAQDAVCFACHAQQVLLDAPWPDDLLQLPMCRPIFMELQSDMDPFTHVPDKKSESDPLQLLPTPSLPSSSARPRRMSRSRRISILHPLPSFSQTLRLGQRSKLNRQIPKSATASSIISSSDITSATSSDTRDLDAVISEAVVSFDQLPSPAVPVYKRDHSAGPTETFFSMCQRAWVIRPGTDTEGARLAFRGLGVHMGIHSGVTENDVIKGSIATGGRTLYKGGPLEVARLLCGCGRRVCWCLGGGTINLSDSTYKLLQMETLWQDVGLMHQGLHLLSEHHPPMNIYQVMDRALRCRIATLASITSLQQLDVSTLQAPTGRVVVAFMKVVGVEVLESWNQTVCGQALALFHQVVLEQLRACHGYQLEAKSDLVLASFFTPEDAVSWAVQCVSLLLQAPWPQALLDHELGEAVVFHKSGGASGAGGRRRRVSGGGEREPPCVLLRGLRVKVGLDHGSVMASVQPITGKLCYRGRVMNRAARISGVAVSGQVVCSAAMWNRATGMGRVAPTLDSGQPLAATALPGPVRLKGLRQSVELVSVTAAGCCRSHWQMHKQQH